MTRGQDSYCLIEGPTILIEGSTILIEGPTVLLQSYKIVFLSSELRQIVMRVFTPFILITVAVANDS